MVKIPIESPKLQVKLENNVPTLRWNMNHGNQQIKYEIKRTITSGKNYETLENNVMNDNFIDSTAKKRFKYYYIITAYEREKNSINSNEASIIMPPSPPKAVTLKLTQNNTVLIKWENSEGNINTTYKIKRSLSSKKNYKTISKDLVKNFYVDEKSIPRNRLYYIVTAINEEGKETDSDEVSIVTAPLAPTNLTAILEKDTIKLDWDKVDSNTSIEYEIKRTQVSGGKYETISKGIFDTKYIDKIINPEEKYFYVVTAKTEGGKSQDSNEASVQSHEGRHIANTLRTSLGVRYVTLKEDDLQNNSYANFYSAASPSVFIDQIQNWEDNLFTYTGIGDLYLDMMQSPIYIMQNRHFHLFNAHIGGEYSTQFHLYLQNEISVEENLIYQLQGYNTMQDQTSYVINEKISAGYTFYQIGTLKAQAEASYILTTPQNYLSTKLGNGYEGAIKISQQNSNFAVDVRLFYTNRIINMNTIKSNMIELGIVGELSLELGYQ